MGGPLGHVRVLELSRVLAGPWAAQTLADLGASVIKMKGLAPATTLAPTLRLMRARATALRAASRRIFFRPTAASVR